MDGVDGILKALILASGLHYRWLGVDGLTCPLVYVQACDNEAMDVEERLKKLTTGNVQVTRIDVTHGKLCDIKNSPMIAKIVGRALSD